MAQLESLRSITRMQSEQQLALLKRKKQTIAILDRQLSELVAYSSLYQRSTVGSDENLPTLLVHRQKFISRLGKQIDELSIQISKLNIDAEECATLWGYLDARKNAIESMHERNQSLESFLKAKKEQQDVDELTRKRASVGFDTAQQSGVNHA